MAIEFTRQTALMNLVNQHVQVCSHVRETQSRIDKSDTLKTLIFILRYRRTKVLKFNMITFLLYPKDNFILAINNILLQKQI